ncbi:MAG: hypothetical protein IPN86_09430 [Saprospiraceae bacterium]|jgi:predicted transposase/invertase (TIGR01784 family)|nr:hypothetical protein [Saprospiraceae bacterium]
MDIAAKQQYDQYLKEVKISKDMIDNAIQKGEQIGIQKGEQIGIQKVKVEVVLTLNEDGIPISQIAKYTNLSEQEVNMILTNHNKQK